MALTLSFSPEREIRPFRIGFHQYNRLAGNRKEVFDYRQERILDVNNSSRKSVFVEMIAAWRQEWSKETHALTPSAQFAALIV
jgi:hypothetical protein